jgi:F-type H+-transporting ATPase subunit b
MLIDWFTIIAQLVNFLVLVWLLKRFLYRPIMNTIDDREKRIANELADADTQKAQAEKQREEFLQKNTLFDQQRTDNINKMNEEVKVERTRLLDLVRQEADALRNKLELALKNEQLSLQDALSQRAREEVFAIVRKALSSLADASLEESMAAVFVKRLDGMSDDEKASFQSAFSDSKEALIVHSAFDLAKKQQTLIIKTLNKLLGDELTIQFIVEPDVISGIEINGHGQKIGWSINDYLATLTKRVNEVMQSHHNNGEENHEKSQEQVS